MRHVLSAIVQNVPGVLAHISGMLASRGYNIDSLAVGETEDHSLSRMTFVVVGDDRVQAYWDLYEYSLVGIYRIYRNLFGAVQQDLENQ